MPVAGAVHEPYTKLTNKSYCLYSPIAVRFFRVTLMPLKILNTELIQHEKELHWRL